MTDAELDLLVAQIGEEFIARLGKPAAAPAPAAAGGYDAPASAASVSAGPGDAKLAAMIDHTLLRADATREEILQICAEARTHGFPALAKALLPAMQGRRASMVTLSYLGAVRALPSYNTPVISVTALFPGANPER